MRNSVRMHERGVLQLSEDSIDYIVEEVARFVDLQRFVPVGQRIRLFNGTTREENSRAAIGVVSVRVEAYSLTEDVGLCVIILGEQPDHILHMKPRIVHTTIKPFYVLEGGVLEPVLHHHPILAPQAKIVSILTARVDEVGDGDVLTRLIQSIAEYADDWRILGLPPRF